MNAIEILERWASYSEYDPEQKKFNLLSTNYEMNRICKAIEAINAFDPTGTMAVLYTKKAFESLCADVRVTMREVLEKPETFHDDMEMWNLLHSEDVKAVETSLLDSIDQLVTQVVPTKQLGERNREQERTALYGSVETVVKEMTGLRCELFLRGSKPIQSVSKFSTSIHVYPSLAACLMELERAENGIYLCYIDCSGTSDSYFSFFLCSNGNIIALTERVAEAYPGQHKNSRNGRWQEALKTGLFPYSYIMSFSGHDYKGYPSLQRIDEEKLAFFQLGADAYMPILLAMVLINQKYNGADTQGMELMLVDSLMTKNLALKTPKSEALMVPTGSLVAAQNAAYEPQVTSDSILHQETPKGVDTYILSGYNSNDSKLFVELYGDGFRLDKQKLLLASTQKLLPSSIGVVKVDKGANCEFIGTSERMDLIAYQQGREQLAEYIRDKMYTEYKEYGGVNGVRRWWETAVKDHKDTFFRLCVEKYHAVQQGEEENVSSPGYLNGRVGDALRFVSYREDGKDGEPPVRYSEGTKTYLNKKVYANSFDQEGKCLCPITGNKASIFFTFRPSTWKDLAMLVGEKNIPKILIGWRREGHSGSGNPLLSVTDPVTFVGTPFERTEYSHNRRYWSGEKWSDYLMSSRMFNEDGNGENRDELKAQFEKSHIPFRAEDPARITFSVTVGFSKRGFAALLKGALPTLWL